MKKKLLSLLLLGGLTLTAGAQVVTQIPNSNFNGEWKDCYPWSSTTNYNSNEKVVGVEPSGWHISNIYNSSLDADKTTVGAKTTDAENDYSVTLTNKGAMGQSFPAYLSLGTPWSTAQAKLFGTIKDGSADGGVFGGFTFDQKPDAVRLSYKRSLVSGSSERASVITYLWAGQWQQSTVPANVTYNFGSYVSTTTVDMVDRDRNVLFGNKGTVGGDITQRGELIAKKEFYITDATADWTEVIIPLEYLSNSIPEKLNIIIASNDFFADRSGITQDNSLSVDDISLIYYSTLKGISYDGVSYDVNAVKETSEGTLRIPVVYDEAKITLTSGKSANIQKDYDAESGLLTIDITNVDNDEDGRNAHTYYVQFAKPDPLALLTASFDGTSLEVDASKTIAVNSVYSADGWTFTTSGENAFVSKKYNVETGLLELVVMQTDGDGGIKDNYLVHKYQFEEPQDVVTYTEELTVNVYGQDMKSTSPIKIAKMSDGTAMLGLSDFVLGDPFNLPVGDIVVDGLTIVNEEGIDVFKYQGNAAISKTIQLAPGSITEDYKYNSYAGPMLGDVPLTMTAESANDEYFHTVINIVMTSMDNLEIKVSAGTDIVAQTESAPLTETGAAHVVLNRQFLQGWNTVCLPFAATPAEVTGDTEAVAQKFVGVDADGLDFESLAYGESMEANTPYLIYVTETTAGQTFIADVILMDATQLTEVQKGETGNSFTFVGNYTANMPMAGLYGVANAEGEEVQRIMLGGANSKLQGTRAYFKTDNQSNVSGMRIRLEGEGDVTAIDGVQVLSGSCDVYNLQGLRVRTAATSLEGLTPGVYVVNGKKVLVK